LLEKRKRLPNGELGAPSFEVIRLRRNKAREIFGKQIPACESIPPSEAWGCEGWTFGDAKSARQKFKVLVNGDRLKIAPHLPHPPPKPASLQPATTKMTTYTL
jgi:hypothetical protein